MDCFLKRTTPLWDEKLEPVHLIKCVHGGKYAKKPLEFPLYAKKCIRLVDGTEGCNSRECPEVEVVGY